VSIDRRIAKLEASTLPRLTEPTAAEAAAAYQRVTVVVRDNFIARITGSPVQESDEYLRDRETVRRYYASKGPITLDPSAKERLRVMLDRRCATALAEIEETRHRTQ
jgi:hypothetical protein